MSSCGFCRPETCCLAPRLVDRRHQLFAFCYWPRDLAKVCIDEEFEQIVVYKRELSTTRPDLKVERSVQFDDDILGVNQCSMSSIVVARLDRKLAAREIER